MAFQIVINIGIAILWMFLQNEFTFVQFTLGYVLGIVLLFVLRRFLGTRFYMERVVALVKLIALFIYELILANIDMLKIVLSPRLNITPGIVAVPTSLKTDWEKTTLAALISLTPGTLSMAFSEEGDIIYVHFIHMKDKEEAVKNIKEGFERAILEVTR
ncbi:cation antiporter [Caldalkalibacillus thermarum TA2.A1]|uniref:Cation antiporter n=1 Tax=Caldalkalibacillus thermarum (strain TA2.A1) TaxID=986075 RepID=F5L8P2_CALTT|nr:Na+/H+ antiporter subunit E [Caldalkalibacillus thermarum]EGL82281.1 cation antiporter [Caldalkalibacillus thermarum TA2.A1]QZT33426.1 Na+/H+ antiporter subunit E [Caldalkalibacillus thermarum TA2.A1]GGK18149.1 cation:proton antiporter [Caldalkalibacillus thermarum]